MKPSRNDPCPCGSGKKYKHCCERTGVAQPSLSATDSKRLQILFNTEAYADVELQATALLVQFPEDTYLWKILAMSLQRQGKASLTAFQKIAALIPTDAGAHMNLGNALHAEGYLDLAIISFQRSLVIKQNFAEAHNNLGSTFFQLNQLENAAASYQKALRIKPDFADAHCGLGNVLRQLGQLELAIASYRRAIKVQPDFIDAYNNLGVTYQEIGQFDESVSCYRKALNFDPSNGEIYSNLGVALRDLGKLKDAAACLKQALNFRPDDFEAHSILGLIWHDSGQYSDAIASYRNALRINPNFPEAYNNLGFTLHALGQYKDAIINCTRAIELEPNFFEAHNNLGNAFYDIGKFDDAILSYQQAIILNPQYAEAHNNLGCALKDSGRFTDALNSYRLALDIEPDYAVAYSNLLFCLNHSESITAQELFEEHCNFSTRFELPLIASWPQHDNVRDALRSLHIGFVSGDLCDHAVANFIEPVISCLSKYTSLVLHAYYNRATVDHVTQRIQKYVTHWHPIAALTDDELAHKIRADKIDILYDLSGHTGRNRLLTFARKPAPIQISWLGYPGTTGLRAMDYYQSDRFFFPDSRFDSQFTEKIIKLPASSAFLPYADSPAVNPLPAFSNGYVTFGSFNRLTKISRSVVALWAQILRALPNARMLLGAMPQEGKYQTLIDWFIAEGVDLNRLSFHSRSDMNQYLALHHQVDICLDTFPYNGGTTTFHALWMGIPTLTLGGNTMAGWAGASILGHVDLNAFATHSLHEFEQQGLYWAQHLTLLSEIRLGLRDRFAQSARARPDIVAAAMNKSLRILWQQWCNNLPAQPIEVTLQDAIKSELHVDT